MAKYVYLFKEGEGTMKNLLGGKGANLAEMTRQGMPVPQGFTVTTEACTKYYEDAEVISPEIEAEIWKSLEATELELGKKFGDPANPLLLSVRSGSRASMPGMMDTVLNLGLNDVAVEGLAALTGNPRFAYDSYRRFIQMFSDVVLDVPKHTFEHIIDELKSELGITDDACLTADNMKTMVERFKAHFKAKKGFDFPQDPRAQLLESIKAVFRSWNNDRANVYRMMHNIPYSWGTAVNVQAMVFGNMGDTSGTGVAFSRNPSTGENVLYGEFLMNAQGEDVVAGIRTPKPISALRDINAEVYEQFAATAKKLENHYRDMQDMEFTIENGKLYMLQTRNGKRTAQAAIRTAVEMVEEGLNTKEEAICKVDANQLDALLHPTFDDAALKNATPIGKGLPASPGAAFGKVYFTADCAVKAAEAGEKVILVRLETSPEDIEGMNAAEGILTARGGMTSHAAVVARGMGTCCVAGCHELKLYDKYCMISDVKIAEGDVISLDGSTGNIYQGEIATKEAELTGDFGKFMAWVDEIRTMKVRANADSPHDSEVALKFGAEGIGLCRTEHMFFQEDRILAVREMIVAKTVEDRQKALDKLLPMQQGDFEGIFTAMAGYPVTIRLLDPPLHEFLPHTEADITTLAKELGISYAELKETVDSLHEFNPMMGHRGCRLAVTYPEIAAMQAKAIIQAAINVNKKTGSSVVPEIMIPLVGEVRELKFVKDVVVKTADETIAASGASLEYMVGTMIEIPRAALTADEVAAEAEFFSFGTNDLTQMTFGFSRDDAGKFLGDYYAKKIYESDPFVRLDQTGTGQLVTMACEKGRAARPEIKLGICGEHGGEPTSVEFCYKQGLNYVSCSPFRVPIARLAAAQAQVNNPDLNYAAFSNIAKQKETVNA